jgi:hypothetical protein
MPPQIQGISIVLRGDFNPAIFHPSWFAYYELLRKEEVDAAKVQLIHPDAAVFSTEWLEFNAARDRFQVSTAQEAYYEYLRDLVVSILNLLTHTPLRVMGINRAFHYRFQSAQQWHNVGHTLVPKQQWESLLENPGMRTLVVEGKRTDGLQGYIQVRVAPSTRVDYGVFVEVNDHYVLDSDKTPPGATEAMRILTELWTESMKRGLSIADKISHLGST